jgi:hypothetical protein
VPFINDVIDLDAVVVNVQDGTAGADSGRVPQQVVDRGIGMCILQNVSGYAAKNALWNDVSREGITDPCSTR